METQFTQGKWRKDRYGKIMANQHDTLLVDGVALPAGNHPDIAEARANNQLLFAAPDLLAACKAFVALAENDTIMVKKEGREPLMTALTLANEAITKAQPGDTKE